MLGWIKEPHYYFEDFEGMVNSIFIWIAIGYLVFNIGAFIFCMIKYHDDGKEEIAHNFGIALWINTCVVILAFAVACVVFASGVYFKEQNYNLFHDWYDVLVKKPWVMIVCGIVAVAMAIFMIVVFISGDMEGWGAIILGILIGGATFAASLYIIGFIVYCVVWFVWLIIRFIMVIVSSFAVSIGLFVGKHYLIFSLTIGVPAVLFGLIGALLGYIDSFQENVGPAELDARLRYVETSRKTSTPRQAQKKDDDEDIVIN